MKVMELVKPVGLRLWATVIIEIYPDGITGLRQVVVPQTRIIFRLSQAEMVSLIRTDDHSDDPKCKSNDL